MSKKIFPRGIEHEAIYILREVAAQFEKPAILFSGRKGFNYACAVSAESFLSG